MTTASTTAYGVGMERFTTSDGSPPKPGWSRTSLLRPMTSTGSMLDVQTSHQQRRQTFARGGGVGRDDSGRRMSMSVNTAGLFDSIRRMSLDPSQIQQLAHQGEVRTPPLSCVLLLSCLSDFGCAFYLCLSSSLQPAVTTTLTFRRCQTTKRYSRK
jgi:hypothetical protein